MLKIIVDLIKTRTKTAQLGTLNLNRCPLLVIIHLTHAELPEPVDGRCLKTYPHTSVEQAANLYKVLSDIKLEALFP